MWSGLTALLLWTSLGASPEGILVTAAAASGRPTECIPPSVESRLTARPSSVWTRARHPGIQRYCSLLARGQARLAFDPAGAQTAAQQAEAALPGRAAPLVLQARAALALGKLDQALKLFDRARREQPSSVEQPLALRDLASALRKAGELSRALNVYRTLVPRAALLPSRGDRALTLLEAAHVCMALPDADRDPLDEAMAYLREAARHRHHAFGTDVALSLALALDRAGRASLADAIVEELAGGVAWAERADLSYVSRPADERALRALALERHRPGDAIRLWRRVLEEASLPPNARRAARARLGRLEQQAPRAARRARP